MPEKSEKGFFESEESYCSVLFHELAYATGHPSHLARKLSIENKGINATGEEKKVYAEEELVVEMSAAFLNAHAGIMETEIQNSAAYFAGLDCSLEVQRFQKLVCKSSK